MHFSPPPHKSCEMAEELGFVRIADIAGQIACEREFSAFRRLELRLFEELAAVEQSAPSQLAGAALVPGAVLQNWCADQAFDALIELSHSLDEMHKEPGSTPCDGVIELFRLIYHACRHYHMETAAHLSMSLIDLFSRARDDRTPPDPMLLRISRSFSADLEILLDTAGSGGTPDMALIERLFEEAANVTFTANGTISVVHQRTNSAWPAEMIPESANPESLKTAAAAMNQGLQFWSRPRRSRSPRRQRCCRRHRCRGTASPSASRSLWGTCCRSWVRRWGTGAAGSPG